MSETRVRIAPSPTGDPHVGTGYIALFNYCLAKKDGGKFILRIEDTDQSRCSKESENMIFDSLRWLGLEWDEGPDIGGEYGPYRQSERLDIYKKYANELVEKGHAYQCFCSKERLDQIRKVQTSANRPTGYDGQCRRLSSEEAKSKIDNGEAHVIRMKIDRTDGAQTSFYDEIRKKDICYQNKEIDDQVILKGDGFPTYHLASVVDDYLMKITHVIRGEEWMTSTPKHILLYQYFGWDIPKFAHLSLLRNADKNKSKISKRKNPVSLTWFRACGYMPHVMINFFALMGYHAQDEEKFTIDTITKSFDFNNFGTSSPAFDFIKLNNLNGLYLREGSQEEFISYICQKDKDQADYLKSILAIIQERVDQDHPFQYWVETFFKRALVYSKEEFDAIKREPAEISKVLKDLAKYLEKLQVTNEQELKEAIMGFQEKSGFSSKQYMMTVRVSTLEKKYSLPLFESLWVIGKDGVTQRLKQAKDFLNQK
ncbi:MAG: glutamate--tRNA ligase [Planctomycetota bacterium]|nr:MAG: glutamate--tRNA ligase [Planctomycetota bacterium]